MRIWDLILLISLIALISILCKKWYDYKKKINILENNENYIKIEGGVKRFSLFQYFIFIVIMLMGFFTILESTSKANALYYASLMIFCLYFILRGALPFYISKNDIVGFLLKVPKKSIKTIVFKEHLFNSNKYLCKIKIKKIDQLHKKSINKLLFNSFTIRSLTYEQQKILKNKLTGGL